MSVFFDYTLERVEEMAAAAVAAQVRAVSATSPRIESTLLILKLHDPCSVVGVVGLGAALAVHQTSARRFD